MRYIRVVGIVRVVQLGEAEVEHFDATVCGERDVGRLEIAMDDPLVVRRHQCVGNLSGDRQRFIDRNGAFGNALSQRLPFDELHHEELRAGCLLEAVQCGDMGVVERREQLGLALEAREPLGIGRERLRQDLQRDLTTELRVARAIHLTHPARAEWRDHFIGPEPGAGIQRHVWEKAERILAQNPAKRRFSRRSPSQSPGRDRPRAALRR